MRRCASPCSMRARISTRATGVAVSRAASDALFSRGHARWRCASASDGPILEVPLVMAMKQHGSGVVKVLLGHGAHARRSMINKLARPSTMRNLPQAQSVPPAA
jgi:hypothetical protein